jgi:leucyl/phenylalanyl-tRNA---protein transferase
MTSSVSKSQSKPLLAPLPQLGAGEAFPDVNIQHELSHEMPGLVAVGGALDVATLKHAYSQGIFPWFSAGQPILWWSTDPRMVLRVEDYKVQPSFKKTLKKFQSGFNGALDCEVRFDTAFERVIAECSTAKREGQGGTWIVPQMVDAYIALHKAGFAHSVETWVNGKLVGGLYCVNIGSAVFGESMFSHATDASKIALAALVCFCRANGVEMIDCQQNTAHLASLGAREMPRDAFVAKVQARVNQLMPIWQFTPQMWQQLLQNKL